MGEWGTELDAPAWVKAFKEDPTGRLTRIIVQYRYGRGQHGTATPRELTVEEAKETPEYRSKDVPKLKVDPVTGEEMVYDPKTGVTYSREAWENKQVRDFVQEVKEKTGTEPTPEEIKEFKEKGEVTIRRQRLYLASPFPPAPEEEKKLIIRGEQVLRKKGEETETLILKPDISGPSWYDRPAGAQPTTPTFSPEWEKYWDERAAIRRELEKQTLEVAAEVAGSMAVGALVGLPIGVASKISVPFAKGLAVGATGAGAAVLGKEVKKDIEAGKTEKAVQDVLLFGIGGLGAVPGYRAGAKIGSIMRGAPTIRLVEGKLTYKGQQVTSEWLKAQVERKPARVESVDIEPTGEGSLKGIELGYAKTRTLKVDRDIMVQVEDLVPSRTVETGFPMEATLREVKIGEPEYREVKVTGHKIVTEKGELRNLLAEKRVRTEREGEISATVEERRTIPDIPGERSKIIHEVNVGKAKEGGLAEQVGRERFRYKPIITEGLGEKAWFKNLYSSLPLSFFRARSFTGPQEKTPELDLDLQDISILQREDLTELEQQDTLKLQREDLIADLGLSDIVISLQRASLIPSAKAIETPFQETPVEPRTPVAPEVIPELLETELGFGGRRRGSKGRGGMRVAKIYNIENAFATPEQFLRKILGG